MRSPLKIIFTIIATIATLLVGGLIFSKIYNPNQSQGPPSKSIEAYSKKKLEIQKLLLRISQECRMGQVDQAQNSFLELQQEWQRMDVVAKNIPSISRESYFPSDSLNTLGNLIDSLYTSKNSDVISNLTIEMQYIVDKIDHQ